MTEEDERKVRELEGKEKVGAKDLKDTDPGSSHLETDIPTERLVPFQEIIRDGLPALITAMGRIATAVERLASEAPEPKKTRM